MENKPINATVKGIPENRLILFMVKRGIPVMGSIPTVDSARPIAPESSPLTGDPCDREAMIVMPSTATEVSSTGPNITATRPSRGATVNSTILLTTPPTKEANSEMPRACPASPRVGS